MVTLTSEEPVSINNKTNLVIITKIVYAPSYDERKNLPIEYQLESHDGQIISAWKKLEVPDPKIGAGNAKTTIEMENESPIHNSNLANWVWFRTKPKKKDMRFSIYLDCEIIDRKNG